MKKNISLFFILILGLYCKTTAQDFTEKIRSQVVQNSISGTDALFLQAIAMYAPEELPIQYRDLDFKIQKSGFRIQAEIKKNFDKFSNEQKEFLNKYLSRPDLPFSYISPDSLFKIHYTTLGPDAVPDEDYDFSGVPDYVEEVAASMDYNYQIEVLSLGLNSPPLDNNKDGPEWDVYIENISNYYGWTTFDTKLSDDPEIWTSYMNIDNDYTHTPTRGLDGMKVTTAHEFFHMIQLGYNFRNQDIYLMEAGSTWMEDVVYDDINDYLFYLNNFFRSTNTPFTESDGAHEYGLCLWFHYLDKRLQTRDYISEVWDNIVDYASLTALHKVLNKRSKEFSDELTLFYAWNYLTGNRADIINYYPEGDTYPEIRNSDLNSNFTFINDTTISDDVISTGAKYYKITVDDETSIIFVPVNIDTGVIYNSDIEFIMNLTRNKKNIYQYYLTRELYLNLSSEDSRMIKGAVIIQNPDNTNEMLLIDATSYDLITTDDIPQCYPNPFIIDEHNYVSIPFEFGGPGEAEIRIFTPSGYLVWEDEETFVGLTIFQWEGRNIQGREVSGGIYTYVISSGNKVLRQGKIAVIN